MNTRKNNALIREKLTSSPWRRFGHAVLMVLGLVTFVTGWTLTYVTSAVARSRFTTLTSSLTPAQFVERLNANAGNPLSTSERNQLVSDLSTGAKTRAQVLREIAENQNLVAAEFNRAFVLMQYYGYLRRNPDDPQDTDYTGYDFWLTKLNLFNGNYIDAEMVKAFINSIECRQRFGPP